MWRVLPGLTLVAFLAIALTACARDGVTSDVSAEAVLISPTSGPPGTLVEVVAGGLPTRTAVLVGIGESESDYQVVQSERTGADAQIRTQFQIPDDARAGDSLLVIIAQEATGVVLASDPFQVTSAGNGGDGANEPDATPAVAVAPLSGPPSTRIVLVGTGIPRGTTVRVGFGQADADYQVVRRLEAGPEGIVQTTLRVPSAAKPGQRWVAVVEADGQGPTAMSNAFEVTATSEAAIPAAAIDPVGGPAGTRVDVSAYGFPPGVTVDIGVGPWRSEYEGVGTAETDPAGWLGTRVTIPEYAEPGDQWVVIVTYEEGKVQAVSNVFLVTTDAMPAEPTAEITPASGPPGTSVQLTASGLPPDVPFQLGVGRISSEFELVGTVETNRQGAVQAEVAIPESARPGERWIVVLNEEQQGLTLVSNAFNITRSVAKPTATPGRALFTRTNIYLIAVDDGGEVDKLVGCNDSVVPVEVEIEPTIAPLTAALEALLSVESRSYGESELYNALYRSDLRVVSVDIDERTAIIRLSGSVQLGGVCDTPRVQAQIRQTALQFRTVDAVNVTIDGRSLDDL
jgi:hypothetical protein